MVWLYIFSLKITLLKLDIMEYSYQFTHAIVRKPAKSINNGLRAVDIGKPNYDQMMLDHSDYVAGLVYDGAQIIE